MATQVPELVVPRSMLDTDLYKLTMQQAVLHHFPDVRATYRFTHRSQGVYFSRACAARLTASVAQFATLALTPDERALLERRCPYFTRAYLDYLAAYRFAPSQVRVAFVPVPPAERGVAGGADSENGEEWGHLEIEAEGPWAETIMWEVPLMACLSELYFCTDDTDWSYDGQQEQAYAKAVKMFAAGCAVSEFGTRRRRSYATQDLVVGELVRASADAGGTGKLTGTSNVHLAMKYDLNPIGTIAHEWFMGVAALKGYELCNGIALDLWSAVYPNALLIALTDTFSTEAFFKDFTTSPTRAQHWTGLRQDSGDPFVFAPRAIAVYKSLGVDYTKKTIVYSDALDVDKVLRLKAQCDALRIGCGFGIGTSLTNDFARASSASASVAAGAGTADVAKSKALNMVIKLAAVGGEPCVKISDDLQKNTGDKDTVRRVKELFGLPAS